MKSLLSVIVLAVLVAALSADERGKKPKPHPVLRELKPELEALFAKKKLSPKISFPERYQVDAILEVEQHTQVFTVHLKGKVDWMEGTQKQKGPNTRGIWMFLSVNDIPWGKETTADRIYWKKYYNSYPIEGEKKHLWIQLQYGERISAELREAINRLVKEKAKTHNKRMSCKKSTSRINKYSIP